MYCPVKAANDRFQATSTTSYQAVFISCQRFGKEASDSSVAWWPMADI